jgi:hypothetical protein
MNKPFCLFSNRYVLSSTVIALLPLAAGFARADTITTFDVSGTSQGAEGQSCNQDCPFFGTLTVDVTAGSALAGQISFLLRDDVFLTFTHLADSRPTEDGTMWEIGFSEPRGPSLGMVFTTTPTPGSLVGFTGGTIVDGAVPLPTYENLKGSIMPVGIPEPGTLLLLSPILLVGLWFGRKQICPRV